MYLGIDIGTSSVKVVLAESQTKILTSSSSKITVSRPKLGWSEQNPNDCWGSLNKAIFSIKKSLITFYNLDSSSGTALNKSATIP